MKNTVLLSSRLVTLLLMGSLLWLPSPKALNAQEAPTLAPADIERMIQDLSNWGRWGEDDQLGTLNLITPAKRREAAALVQIGVSVSLAHDVETIVGPDNPNPFSHNMVVSGESGGQWAVDSFCVQFHGYAHTHMDSLCHIFHNDKMYNGFSRDEVTRDGAKKLHIGNVKNGIFTRGILMDIPKLKGVDFLSTDTAILVEDLEAWEKQAGVKVSSGDVLIIRTGRWARRARSGAWDAGNGSAGLHASCTPWLKERDIAVLGSDVASDVLPSGIEGFSHPVHLIVLHALGVHIFDNLDVEALSETCAKLERWDFLLTVAPLAVQGGTGSPFNPIATF